MWSFKAWRQRRILAKHPISAAAWSRVRQQLPILDGLSAADEQRLRDRAVLFLHDKHLTAMPGVNLQDEGRLHLAALAELPLLQLDDLDWYQGFHEIVLYPDDFRSPQRQPDAGGVIHEWSGQHSGEAWLQGPVILAWPGVLHSGQWPVARL